MASKSYILDTSVIIDSPDCIGILRNGEENTIIIPYSVILELAKLKRNADLSFVVSEIADTIEQDPLVRIIKHADTDYRDTGVDDERILADILAYMESLSSDEREKTFVVSNDTFFRIQVRQAGMQVQEFRSSQPVESESQMYTGFSGESENIPNSFSWIEGKPYFNGVTPRVVDHENHPWSITPRSTYQNLACELMLDPGIDIVTVQSQAGYGKTYLALACALELVLAKPRRYEKIYIVKPNVEIGEKLGFLPGEMLEKLQPYVRPIEDLIIKLHECRPANRLFLDTPGDKARLNPKKCEIIPLNYIRGMNLEDCVVIVDEAQNLTRLQTRTLLTRMGQGVKCFVLGDTDQVDHPYLNRFNNGLNWIVKKCRGYWNYGHIVLKGSKSRGPITDTVLKANL